MIGIFVLPTTWDGQRKVDSPILVEVDGKVNHGIADVPNGYSIPDGAKSLSISATPVSDEWRQAAVTIDVLSNGTLKVKTLGAAAAVDISVLPSPGFYSVMKVFIRLLRVHDATADFVKLFDTSATPPLSPAVVPAGLPAKIQNVVKAMNITTPGIQNLVKLHKSPVDVPGHTLRLIGQRPVILDLVKADAVTALFA